MISPLVAACAIWRGQVKCGGRDDIWCSNLNWVGQVVSGGSQNYILVCFVHLRCKLAVIITIGARKRVFYSSAQNWRLILVLSDWNVLPQSYGKIDPEVDPEPKNGSGGWSGAQQRLRIWSEPNTAWSGRKTAWSGWKKDHLRMTEVGHEKIPKNEKVSKSSNSQK